MLKNRFRRLFFAMMAAVFLFVGMISAALSVCASGEPEPVLTQKELDFAGNLRPLKVGYVADRIPISFQDEKTGELGGVSRKIFDRIQELSGLTFEYVALPGGSVTYDYLTGESFDLVTSVEYNQKNAEARGILMSRPYLMTRKVIIGRADLAFDMTKELKIAIATGSQTIKKVLAEQYPNFEIVDYDTITGCFEAVRSGEADLLILNQYVAEYWLAKPRYHSLEIIPVIGLDDELCFSAVVSLEQVEDDDWKEKEKVIEIINKVIPAISDDETANYIIEATVENQYSYNFSDFVYHYRVHIVIAVLVSVIVCVLIFVSIYFYLKTMNGRTLAKVKDQFLSTMSHEMRTPLNGIIGLNYLMLQNLGEKEKLTDYLRQSSSTAQYLQSLVNDILDMSMIRNKEFAIQEKPFSIPLLLSTIETLERGRMEEKGITFRVESELFCPGLVGDGNRVQQVILNLLDNAWKFTPAGGTVVLRVRQQPAESAGKNVLHAGPDGRVMTVAEVSDTGCGMSEEFQKEIFGLFTRELATVSKGNQGTGLGMPISYRLAKLMGGGLEVRSRVGEGSCFTFSFLAGSADEVPEVPGAGVGPVRRADGKKRGILVAEDNELNAEILTELLQEEGYEVALAENGKKAADIFAASEKYKYQFILMDLVMPVMDGFEAARKIRAMARPDAKTVKIFACTANSSQEDRDRAFGSGMDDFLTKPINVGELLEMLETRE